MELFDVDLGVNATDAAALSVRATCQARLGRVDEAQAGIARAVQLTPDDPDVQYQRALVLSLAGRRDEALSALQRAVSLGYSRALLSVDQDLGTLRSSTRFQALLTGTEPPRRTK